MLAKLVWLVVHVNKHEQHHSHAWLTWLTQIPNKSMKTSVPQCCYRCKTLSLKHHCKTCKCTLFSASNARLVIKDHLPQSTVAISAFASALWGESLHQSLLHLICSRSCKSIVVMDCKQTIIRRCKLGWKRFLLFIAAAHWDESIFTASSLKDLLILFIIFLMVLVEDVAS